MDRNAEVIILNGELRASDLRQSIRNMLEAPQLGSGFPLLETSENGDMRISGYVGLVELEHCLSTIDGDPICTFDGADPDVSPNGGMSPNYELPVDFGYLVDHAPVTVSVQTPMELIHEIFVRLGVSIFSSSPAPFLLPSKMILEVILKPNSLFENVIAFRSVISLSRITMGYT
jgi:chloride channel 3/4/5